MYWTLYALCTLLSAVHVYCGPDDKVSCEQHEEMRNELIDRERCGDPRPVYVELNHTGADEVIHPRSVWVKRCVGYCDHLGPQVKCKPHIVQYRSVPVKVINRSSLKETCAMYQVESHESCAPCRIVMDETCDPSEDEKRYEIISEGTCMYPKEEFIDFTHQYAHKDIFPKGVWVQRCIGLCNTTGPNSVCAPTKKVIKKIPVRLGNVDASKGSCAEYEVEEHEACQMCDVVGISAKPDEVWPAECAGRTFCFHKPRDYPSPDLINTLIRNSDVDLSKYEYEDPPPGYRIQERSYNVPECRYFKMLERIYMIKDSNDVVRYVIQLPGTLDVVTTIEECRETMMDDYADKLICEQHTLDLKLPVLSLNKSRIELVGPKGGLPSSCSLRDLTPQDDD